MTNTPIVHSTHYIEIDRTPDGLVGHVLEDGVLKDFCKRSEKKLNIEEGKSEVDYKVLMKYRTMALDYKEALRLSEDKKLNKKYSPRLNKIVKGVNKLLGDKK